MSWVVRWGRQTAILALFVAPFVVLTAAASPGFLQYLGYAFVGGIVLNIMPCVLPVLTLKAFHVVDALRSHPEKARIHGLAYAIGTTLVFSIFAFIVIGLRASGKVLGWGVHFQHPEFVAAIVIALHVFGLNALGVFEITVGVQGKTSREGLLGSVSNGMLAAVMSTPCTAPFLGTATAFAMGSDATWVDTLGLFVGIGVGLATPFALLAFVPALIRILPRPGPWMESFKHIMGFTLIGAALWFFGSLQKQLTPQSANHVLMFLLALSVALWAIQRFGSIMHGRARRWVVRGIALFSLLLVWNRFVTLEAATLEQKTYALQDFSPVQGEEINWAPFSEANVAEARGARQAILLDFTADWCGACKVLEATVIDTPTIRKRLTSLQVLPMQADYTAPSDEIERWIEQSKRSGIPLVMIIDGDGKRHLMPQVFTIRDLERALDKHAAG